MRPRVVVLRLGHRRERDKRVSTHCGLVARALGASEIWYAGEDDPGLLESVNTVSREWGGSFRAKRVEDGRRALRDFRGVRVHLTFYGEPVQERVDEIRKAALARGSLMVVVGAEKVPSEVYRLADWNVSVTNQPHSEIAALAVFLHEFFEGRELRAGFRGGVKRITPSARGKNLENRGRNARGKGI